MGKNKKTHKQASSENYFALKSGYDQHTNPTLNSKILSHMCNEDAPK